MRWTSHWLHRSFAALVAVWLVLVLAEPAALHSCPVHGGHDVPTDAVGSAYFAPDAAHADHHAEHHADDSIPGDGHAACTCPGDCATPNSAMEAPRAPAITGATELLAATTIRAPASHPRRRVAFATPFANGPPATRRLA